MASSSDLEEPAPRRGGLQTLDRGLAALEHVAAEPEGATVAELAAVLGVHRAIAYRLASTLEARGLVTRGGNGRLLLGPGLMVLASGFQPQLLAAAEPVLRTLADAAGAGAFLSVARGEDCIAVAVAEPRDTLLRIAYRIGSRHPLTQGAAGIAILAGRAPRDDDDVLVRQARADGYALSRGVLQPGATGVASPLDHARAGPRRVALVDASIGVVTLGDPDVVALGAMVVAAARSIRVTIGLAND